MMRGHTLEPAARRSCTNMQDVQTNELNAYAG